MDNIAATSCYADGDCGHFEAQQMVSWRLRRLIRRETERIQRKLNRLNTWLDPMSPLPPPEPPPPSWDIGFPWEIEEMWMYTILDTSADQDGAGSSNSSTPAGNSDVATLSIHTIQQPWQTLCSTMYLIAQLLRQNLSQST